jgi:putative nucleotide binding protein
MLESRAVVLDYLPYGKNPKKPIPIVQGIGIDYFLLVEFIKPKELEVKILEEVPLIAKYRIIKYDYLTETAKENLKTVLRDLVNKKEKEFVEFINKSTAITPRLHMLEILPHIGKKITWKIIEEKEKEPFKSLDEIEERVKSKIDMKEIIVERIIEELQNKDKYKLFVGPNSILRRILRQK